MVKIIGIGGSPRKSGNSDMLLDEALDGARSAGAATEKIVLNDLNFKACQECDGCHDTGICVIKDDMQFVYQRIEESDGLIIASPIFFGSLTAQLKAMIDRFQCLWVKRHILKRPVASKKRKGAFLCVYGSDRSEFFESAKKIVKIFFATLGIEYLGELSCGNLENVGAVKKEKTVLVRAFELGEMLAKSLGQ